MKNDSRIQELRERELSKLYFIHIPKTGGSFVRDSFKTTDRLGAFHAHGNHASFHKLKGDKGYVYLENDSYKDHLTFTVIRNPFDMLVSMCTAGIHGFVKRTDHHHQRTLHEYCDGKIGYDGIRCMLFHQIFDDDGICQADIIIRNEFLEEGLIKVGNLIVPNIAPSFPIKSGAVRHQRNIGTSDKIRVNASNRNRDYKKNRREVSSGAKSIWLLI